MTDLPLSPHFARVMSVADRLDSMREQMSERVMAGGSVVNAMPAATMLIMEALSLLLRDTTL